MSASAILTLIVYAWEQVRALVKNPAVDAAADIAAAIAGIFEAVDAAATGKVTPEIAQAQIHSLVAAINSNDAAADQALDTKFPKA